MAAARLLPFYSPLIFFFFFGSMVLVCRLLRKSHARLQKKSRVRACGEAKTPTHTESTCTLTRQGSVGRWGGGVFPVLCMVCGDESTKYKVGLQGFTGRIFFSFFCSFVNLCLKGLHIKLVRLSPVLLFSLLPGLLALLAAF